MSDTKIGEPGFAASGGRARALNRPLVLSRVLRELPPLTDAASCMQRLELLSNWTAAGLLKNGTHASACARMHELWLQASDYRDAARTIGDLEKRSAKQQKEIATLRSENNALRSQITALRTGRAA